METSILGVLMERLGQGPSAERDSPVPTASKRNRENPAPLPTGPIDLLQTTKTSSPYMRLTS
jgi:hypothetical protein